MKSDIAFVQRKISVYGGGGIFALRFIKQMLADGRRVTLLTDCKPQGLKEKISWVRIPLIKPFSFLKALSFACFSQIAAKKYCYDLILSNERTFYQDIYFAGEGCHRVWIEQRSRQIGPLKRFFISINPLHWTIFYLERRCLKSPRLKGIIAFSQRTREELIEIHRFPPEKIKVVYHGVPAPQAVSIERSVARKDLGIDEDELALLYLGSGFERKGLRYLIEGLSHFKGQPIKLLVVGKGYTGKYRRIARRLGLEDKVQFYGPSTNTPMFYAAADIFALPTLYEPFGLVVLEAMSHGVPVLVSRFAGASELITDAKDGMLIQDPFNPREIGAQLCRMKDPMLRATLAENGRKLAARYTLERNTREIIAAVEALIAG
jgi:UDP-glucose:(heptosyl)LPS alpha-1,3-glucosyltransferase